MTALERRRQAIAEDQLRLRENMKALRGSAEEKQLLQRYTKQLDDQENELGKLRTELGDVTARRDQARADVNALIAAFDIEVE